MDNFYSEVIVKREETGKSLVIKGVLGVIAGISVMLTIISGGMALPISAIILYILYIVYNRLSIEFEYIYLNGELEIDKIMGKSKRKKQNTFNFDNIEIIAPLNSHALDSYKNNSNYKTIDYSSQSKELGIKKYVIITKKDNTLLKVIFEPSEKMLNDMKMTAPRKISQI